MGQRGGLSGNIEAPAVVSNMALQSFSGALETNIGTSADIPIVTTNPESILFHRILDQELGMLSSGQTSRLENFMWAMVGIAGGAVPAAFKDLRAAVYDRNGGSLDLGQLMEIGTFFIPLAIAVTVFFVVLGSKENINSLVSDIRARPRG